MAKGKGIYSVTVGLVNGPGVSAVDEGVDVFKDSSLDHVLITPQIAASNDPDKLIRDLAKKLKVGGHLVVLTNIGEDNAGVLKIFPEMVDCWVHDGGRWLNKLRYFDPSGRALQIYKKLEGKRGILAYTDPRQGKKSVLVARYGALGDAIIMTPLIRQLKKDGYHVTLNINPYCAPALENNPYIDNLIIQEKDMIPNQVLVEYWKFWKGQYDRYINLSESIEGDLLMVEGRPCFYTPKDWRHSVANANYYDHTMRRGGYPEILGTRGELFFTKAEERRATQYFDGLAGKFVIVWALNGSSHHKVYPMMEPMLKKWFETHPEARVITTGDTMAQILEFPHPQMIGQAGRWGIREALISTKYADLVMGPETMMTNASGCYDTPKIVMLSHSTQENLTKYWPNCVALEPTSACYPCHQLHYTKESCPVGIVSDVSTGEDIGQAPICSMSVHPERVMAEMNRVYEAWQGSRKVASA
jgi:ADP-heptose:LPS heptosyltransferase